MAYFHTSVLDNQIKALPTVGTASGSIATFETDMTENLISCVCQLPYNASGYTSLILAVNGKNILDKSMNQDNSNRVTLGQNVANSNFTYFLKAGTYTITVNCAVNATIYYYNNGSVSIGSTASSQTFTISEDIYTSFWIYRGGGVSVSDIVYFQLELSPTATAYSDFVGCHKVVSFGSTIYGGNFEGVTGTLTSKYESDGAEKITPDIIQLSGASIPTSDNETMTAYNDCGDTAVKYLLTVGKAIS